MFRAPTKYQSSSPVLGASSMVSESSARVMSPIAAEESADAVASTLSISFFSELLSSTPLSSRPLYVPEFLSFSSWMR